MSELEQTQAETGEEIPETEESAPSEEQEETQQEEIPSEPVKVDGFQKRINTVTRQKYAAENRADAAEEELRRLKVERPVLVGDVPTLEAFDYDEDKFQDAKIKHQVAQEVSKFRQESEVNQAETVRNQASAEFARKVKEANIEGYAEAIGNLVESAPIPSEVLTMIQQDEKGPELAYYLATNLDIASEIAEATPMQAALKLGKISARLAAQPKKKLTKAPKPVETAGSGGGSGKSMEDMTMDEIYDL